MNQGQCNHMTEITVYKCDHTGDVVWQYHGQVLERADNAVCLTARFDREKADLGFVAFMRGDVFTEWFYTDRWYNVFRVEDGRTGALKGWYCNVTRPAVIANGSVRADDLALDVFVMPNGSLIVLDEDEFDALELPNDERMAALRAIETIRHKVNQRAAPFEDIHPATNHLG